MNNTSYFSVINKNIRPQLLKIRGYSRRMDACFKEISDCLVILLTINKRINNTHINICVFIY